MSKLTALHIKNKKDPGRLSDGQGLFFEITGTGVKRWICCYKIQSKSGKYTVGRYPELSIQEVRQVHQEARKVVSQALTLQRIEEKRKRLQWQRLSLLKEGKLIRLRTLLVSGSISKEEGGVSAMLMQFSLLWRQMFFRI